MSGEFPLFLAAGLNAHTWIPGKFGKYIEGLTVFALKGGKFHSRMELDALPHGKSAPEADHHLSFLYVPCSFFAVHLAAQCSNAFPEPTNSALKSWTQALLGRTVRTFSHSCSHPEHLELPKMLHW